MLLPCRPEASGGGGAELDCMEALCPAMLFLLVTSSAVPLSLVLSAAASGGVCMPLWRRASMLLPCRLGASWGGGAELDCVEALCAALLFLLATPSAVPLVLLLALGLALGLVPWSRWLRGCCTES